MQGYVPQAFVSCIQTSLENFLLLWWSYIFLKWSNIWYISDLVRNKDISLFPHSHLVSPICSFLLVFLHYLFPSSLPFFASFSCIYSPKVMVDLPWTGHTLSLLQLKECMFMMVGQEKALWICSLSAWSMGWQTSMNSSSLGASGLSRHWKPAFFEHNKQF